MIHLCVVWRNGKKTITSSNTVTWEEAFDLVRRKREVPKETVYKEHYAKLIERYYDDLLKDCTALQAEHLTEIIKRKEAVKLKGDKP